MIIEQTIDGIYIDDLVLRKRQNKYKETRKRVTRFKSNYNMSDKEIIEYLAEEIEQYRGRIRNQEEYIKELENKQTILNIKEDKVELKEIEQVEDKDVKEIETINKFADGRLIQSISNYKYKETESTCQKIELTEI